MSVHMQLDLLGASLADLHRRVTALELRSSNFEKSRRDREWYARTAASPRGPQRNRTWEDIHRDYNPRDYVPLAPEPLETRTPYYLIRLTASNRWLTRTGPTHREVKYAEHFEDQEHAVYVVETRFPRELYRMHTIWVALPVVTPAPPEAAHEIDETLGG